MEYISYTKRDIEAHFIHGQQNGLTERVFSEVRALSFILNPSATDEMPLLFCAQQDNAILGYVAAIPERCKEHTIYWVTSLFVDESLRGQGVARQLVEFLASQVEGPYLTIHTVSATAAIFNRLGGSERSFSDYWIKLNFWNDRIGRLKGIKSIANTLMNKSIAWFKKQSHLPSNYSIKYCSYISDSTHQFISAHSNEDIFLRPQEELNWMLKYPFVQSVPANQHLFPSDYFFSHYRKDYRIIAIEVYVDWELVGFYMMSFDFMNANLLYLYVEEKYRNHVYTSIIDQLKYNHMARFRTTDGKLAAFIASSSQYPWSKVKKSSFNLSICLGFTLPNGSIQGGDGDMFVI